MIFQVPCVEISLPRSSGTEKYQETSVHDFVTLESRVQSSLLRSSDTDQKRQNRDFILSAAWADFFAATIRHWKMSEK